MSPKHKACHQKREFYKKDHGALLLAMALAQCTRCSKVMHSNTNVVECSLLNTSDQKRLQWHLIIVQKKAVENRVWKKVKKVTLFCIYLHTKLTYLSAARVDGLLALIRVEFILRDVYFSVLVLAQFIEKGSCDFGKKMLLFSWTCSPPNQKTLKHPKVDPEGAMSIEDVFNV
jgi:hypothetical protein